MLVYPLKRGANSAISLQYDPKVNTNPASTGVIWVNDSTGEIFVCTDDTQDNNVWEGYKPTIKISPTTTDVVDFFGDNSGIALYQLDGNTKDTGGQYDGVANNIAFNDGKFEQAIDYDNAGTSSYIVTSGKIQRNGSEEFTIAGWLNVYGHTGTWLNVWHLSPDNNDDSGNSRQPTLFLYSGDNSKFHIRNDGVNTKNIGIGESKGAITYGDWHHIAQVVTKRQMKFYIDGELTDTFNSSEDLKFNDGYLYIGDKWYDKNFLIDQVRLFNRALTDDEIKQLYQEQ